MGRSAELLQKDWQSWLAHERRASPNTLRAYGDDVSRFLGFQRGHLGGVVTDKSLASLKTADIRAFIAARRSEGLGGGGVQRALAAVRSFYRYLAREGILENAAPRAIRTPRLKRRLPRPLSESDMTRVIEESGTHDVEWLGARDAALLTLLYGAGLRISEALSLKRGDVPLGETVTILGKGRKERMVPVLPLLRDAVEIYAAQIPFSGAPGTPLFLSRRGKPMSPREAQSLMQRLRGRLGLSITATPHALRHSFATHILAGGGDLRSVQELLGHASLSTTQTYTAVETSQLLATYEAAHPRGRGRDPQGR